VGQVDGDGVARLHHQRHRVVRRLDDAHPGNPQVTAGRRGRDRVVLDDDERVEQLGPADPALHIGERGLLVLDDLALARREAAQHVGERLGPGPAHARGQGVDQQAGHRVDAGQVKAAARDRVTEHDVRASGDAAEQHTPGGGEDVAHGDPVRAGDRPHTGAVDGGGEAGGGGVCDRCQERRLGDAVEQPGVRLGVAAAAVGEELPVGRCRWQGLPGVEREEVVQDQGYGPAVRDDVVHGLYEHVPVRREPDEGIAHAGRA
jgi:hypothetical protein